MMASKENKGGILKNTQVEQDNKVKGKSGEQGQYRGMQDTGDDGKRERGTEVQRRDGLPENNTPAAQG
jgi:hypothetical protein